MFAFRIGVTLLLGAVYLLAFSLLTGLGGSAVFSAVLVWLSVFMALMGFALAIAGAVNANRDANEAKLNRDMNNTDIKE